MKKLSTEKNLLEREKLQKKVEDLQETIKEQEEKIQVMSKIQELFNFMNFVLYFEDLVVGIIQKNSFRI